MYFVTLTIFIMGTITVVMSMFVAVIFDRFANQSGKVYRTLNLALKWQLIGEAIIGAGTLLFATAAHFGWLASWSIGLQSSIRFTMFFATCVTTIHLFVIVRKFNFDLPCPDRQKIDSPT